MPLTRHNLMFVNPLGPINQIWAKFQNVHRPLKNMIDIPLLDPFAEMLAQLAEELIKEVH
jgi:hypothetical protein